MYDSDPKGFSDQHDSCSGPSRTRTGTPLRAEDFKSEQASENSASSRNDDPGSHEIAPDRPSTGQSLGNPAVPGDPVEHAIAEALNRASEAGQWTVVEVLARELEARRRARTADNVVPIQRGKREA